MKPVLASPAAVEELLHDIERYLAINARLATDNAELRAKVAGLEARIQGLLETLKHTTTGKDDA